MFGDNPENPQDENTTLMPASPYACAKVFAHNLVRNYRQSYGMHISSGILFNHESPRRGETFVTRKITLAAARIKLGIQEKLYLGNLDAKRDWGFAGDYVELMWKMLQQDVPDDYVIATGETHSVREFLERVFDLAGLDIGERVVLDKKLFRPHEVPILLGNPSKAKEKLGWDPKIKFDALAKMMYEADYNHVLENEIRRKK
jgi:GDPmannose 4,6-dehydratase